MRSRGFTLLEMLLATVLTAVLMVGVLSVIVSIGRPVDDSQAGPAAVGPAGLPADAWVALIREDLANARVVETPAGGIGVMCYGRLDPWTSERSNRPVKVRYRVQQIAGQPWLVRREKPLDADDLAEVVELVGRGVTRLELVAPEPWDPPVTEDEADVPGPPADAVWRLRLWTGEDEEPAVDRPIIARRSLAS